MFTIALAKYAAGCMKCSSIKYIAQGRKSNFRREKVWKRERWERKAPQWGRWGGTYLSGCSVSRVLYWHLYSVTYLCMVSSWHSGDTMPRRVYGEAPGWGCIILNGSLNPRILHPRLKIHWYWVCTDLSYPFPFRLSWPFCWIPSGIRDIGRSSRPLLMRRTLYPRWLCAVWLFFFFHPLLVLLTT